MHGGTARRRPRCPKAMAALLRLWRRLLRRASPGETAPWSELPPELLGLVFSRLPSQADRVRLRAVCRPWRSAARLQPLAPPLPCLVLRDNTMLTLPDGTLRRGFHRLPVDWDDIDFRISTGGMLFLKDRFCRCYLLDPFSRSRETPQRINLNDLHDEQRYLSHHCIRKLVVSRHIVAVLLEGKVHLFPRGEISYSTMVWAPPVNTHVAIDIALFQGKLYVLAAIDIYGDSELPELHVLDISFKKTRIRSVQCIQGMPRNCVDTGLPASQRRCFFFYLVVSGDRLLMVECQTDVEVPFSVGGSSRPIRTQFEVSEWVDLIGCHGRWSKVDTLMGRTLFVSQDCSRSLPAQSGAREDCIYFVTKWMLNPDQDDTLDCVVYNVKDKTMEPLTSEMRAAMQVGNGGRWQPTWLFPADVNLSDIY